MKRSRRPQPLVRDLINAGPGAHRSIVAELFRPLAGVEIVREVLEGTDIPCWRLPVLTCKRCLWKWHPITNNRPCVCPKCKARGWAWERSIWAMCMEARKNPRFINPQTGYAYRRVRRAKRTKPEILAERPPTERFVDPNL